MLSGPRISRNETAKARVQGLYASMQAMTSLVYDGLTVADRLRAQLDQCMTDLQDHELQNHRRNRDLALLMAALETAIQSKDAVATPAQVEALVCRTLNCM